jgi:hypothetical protein
LNYNKGMGESRFKVLPWMFTLSDDSNRLLENCDSPNTGFWSFPSLADCRQRSKHTRQARI